MYMNFVVVSMFLAIPKIVILVAVTILVVIVLGVFTSNDSDM